MMEYVGRQVYYKDVWMKWYTQRKFRDTVIWEKHIADKKNS